MVTQLARPADHLPTSRPTTLILVPTSVPALSEFSLEIFQRVRNAMRGSPVHMRAEKYAEIFRYTRDLEDFAEVLFCWSTLNATGNKNAVIRSRTAVAYALATAFHPTILEKDRIAQIVSTAKYLELPLHAVMYFLRVAAEYPERDQRFFRAARAELPRIKPMPERIRAARMIAIRSNEENDLQTVIDLYRLAQQSSDAECTQIAIISLAMCYICFGKHADARRLLAHAKPEGQTFIATSLAFYTQDANDVRQMMAYAKRDPNFSPKAYRFIVCALLECQRYEEACAYVMSQTNTELQTQGLTLIAGHHVDHPEDLHRVLHLYDVLDDEEQLTDVDIRFMSYALARWKRYDEALDWAMRIPHIDYRANSIMNLHRASIDTLPSPIEEYDIANL